MKNTRKIELWTTTRKDGPFNSTDFTACCSLAVLQEDTHCPGCGAKVSKPEPSPHRKECRMCGKPLNQCYC